MSLREAADEDRMQTARGLFDRLQTISPARQREHLRELTSDAHTIALVEHLIHAHARDIDSGVGPLSALISSLPDTELREGDTLGPWRLVERLASGGMGTVFVAERADALFQQRVAIKLLHGKPDTQTAQRLAAERQLLAQLQHPGIARLYDGGTTPAGQPYLVMEFVPGMSLDRHCQTEQPGLHARIALFQRICTAVEAAHRHLVVHCDLKPANVMVRADGEPVLLDFGIARALGSGGDVAGFCTPAYASPELLSGKSISVASDVFSLGILMTELLSGHRVPRDPMQPGQPVPVSSALADAVPWRGKLRGDLDAIAAKACQVDPEQRYGSVSLLQEDLNRFLGHYPITAVAPSLVYRTRRLLRRRWREASVGALFVALAAGFVWRLDDERDRANREATTASQVSDLMVSAFKAADPKYGGALTAERVLEVATEQFRDADIDDPAVQAEVQYVLATAYINLGQSRQSGEMLKAAVDKFLSPAVNRPDKAAQALSEWAVMLCNDKQQREGTRLGRRALALREPIGDPVEIAESLNTLGLCLVDLDPDEAARSLARALALRRKHLGDSQNTAATLNNLGLLQDHLGHPRQAEAFYRQALAMNQSVGYGFTRYAEHNLTNLASVLRDQGRLEESAEVLLQALEMSRKLGGNGSHLGDVHNELANTLHDMGDWQGAAQQYAAAAKLAADSQGQDSISYAVQLNNQASLDEDRGAWTAAEAGLRRSLAIRSAKLPRQDVSVMRAQFNLGRLLMREGRLTEAAALIEPAWKDWQPQFAPTHPNTLGNRLLMAEWSLLNGRVEQARRHLAGVGELASKLSPTRTAWLHALQADLARVDGDREAELRHRRLAVETLARELGVDHVEASKRRIPYAAALLASGQTAQARAQLQQAVRVLDGQLHEQAPQRVQIADLDARLTSASDQG